MNNFPGDVQPSDPGDERCPWCGQPIAHEKFEEIRLGIAAAERERTAELEGRMGQEVLRGKAEAEAKAAAQVEQVRQDAAKALAKVNEDAAAQVNAAKSAAEAALKPRLAEAEGARADAEQQLQVLKISQDAVLSQRLQEQRAALEKDKVDAVNSEKAKTFAEKLRLEQKLQLVQRQLQNKTANELGEGAEIDLFDLLRNKFPQDDIRRIGKGTEGADIIHKVSDGGRVCGSIVYDSKNRNSWRNDYVTKLRKDQLAAHADHAVLVTLIFPAGARQIHVQDGVIIANPARAAVLVEVLRKHISLTHSLRLSQGERGDKMSRLYDFITSDRCDHLLEEMEKGMDDLLDLDVREKKSHDANWKRRGELIRSVQRVHSDLSSELDRIVEGADQTRVVRVK